MQNLTSKQYLLMSSVVISPDSDLIPLNKEFCGIQSFLKMKHGMLCR